MKYLFFASALLVPTIAYAAPVKACEANSLSLATDSENGRFDATSHSGTLLVLRNLGPDACSLAATPDIIFRSALNGDLTITGSPDPKPTTPAPPIIVAAGAEATASLRWVSGNVFDHGVCLSPFFITVQIGSAEIVAPFQANLCGQPKPTYTFSTFALDPVYTPKKK